MNTYTMIDTDMIITNMIQGLNVYTMTDNTFYTPIQHINKEGVLMCDGTLLPHNEIGDYMWFIDSDIEVTIL